MNGEGEDGMLFWMSYHIGKAIPALHKINKIDVNKNHIKKTVTHTFERAFCRHSLQGSMTVEATLVIPMIFFVWLAWMALTSVVNIHETMQQELGQRALELSLAAGNDQVGVQNLGGWYAWGQTMLIDTLPGGGVQSVSGFDFSESQIMDGKDGILLKVRYKVKLLEGIIPIPSIWLTNQVYTRAWTGGKILEKESGAWMDGEKAVYIAEHGLVYHVDPMCSHIHLTIFMVGEGQTSGYTACEKCMQDGMEHGQTFYITETGEHYHSRLGCSGLKRQVSQIYMTDVGTKGYVPCSRCGGGE